MVVKNQKWVKALTRKKKNPKKEQIDKYVKALQKSKQKLKLKYNRKPRTKNQLNFIKTFNLENKHRRFKTKTFTQFLNNFYIKNTYAYYLKERKYLRTATKLKIKSDIDKEKINLIVYKKGNYVKVRDLNKFNLFKSTTKSKSEVLKNIRKSKTKTEVYNASKNKGKTFKVTKISNKADIKERSYFVYKNTENKTATIVERTSKSVKSKYGQIVIEITLVKGSRVVHYETQSGFKQYALWKKADVSEALEKAVLNSIARFGETPDYIDITNYWFEYRRTLSLE